MVSGLVSRAQASTVIPVPATSSPATSTASVAVTAPGYGKNPARERNAWAQLNGCSCSPRGSQVYSTEV